MPKPEQYIEEFDKKVTEVTHVDGDPETDGLTYHISEDELEALTPKE